MSNPIKEKKERKEKKPIKNNPADGSDGSDVSDTSSSKHVYDACLLNALANRTHGLIVDLSSIKEIAQPFFRVSSLYETVRDTNDDSIVIRRQIITNVWEETEKAAKEFVTNLKSDSSLQDSTVMRKITEIKKSTYIDYLLGKLQESFQIEKGEVIDPRTRVKYSVLKSVSTRDNSLTLNLREVNTFGKKINEELIRLHHEECRNQFDENYLFNFLLNLKQGE